VDFSNAGTLADFDSWLRRAGVRSLLAGVLVELFMPNVLSNDPFGVVGREVFVDGGAFSSFVRRLRADIGLRVGVGWRMG